ncbi:class II fructose-bisphosphatase [Bacillus sp. V3B]|uniref:class II fructose-bisphosphatase n=1 Tax=Bacillus sp. V3B TaxID=2804915 RepID=UPI00210E21BF|nr:class II fructose-bisphosphatase [Bacillus sp. V3B]
MSLLVPNFLAVTQQAAVASYPWIGKMDKIKADDAGTEAMRTQLNSMNMRSTIVIGEGELDEAPMLYIGETLGTGEGPEIDIAVDPVEGTTLMATGQDNSIAVIAAAPKGSFLHAPDMYMQKIAVGPKAKGSIDIEAPFTENMKSVARAMGKSVENLTVMVQDRPRHQDIIQQVIDLGARVVLFSDGDVTAAIATAIETQAVDIFVGIGGAPEGVIAAAGLKCLGGDFQAKLMPENDKEYRRCIRMGIEYPNKAWTIDELVKSDDCLFAASGITDGYFLKGVKESNNGLFTSHSFVTSAKSKSYQFIEAYHW